MKYSISISVSPEYLEIIDKNRGPKENRSKFFVEAAIKEALKRQGEREK